MRFRRKSTLDRLVDTVQHSLAAVGDASPGLPDVDKEKARKAGLVTAGGLAALTAGSAAISSLRRRLDGTRSDS